MTTDTFPDDLRYTAEHEWARIDGATVRLGITSYAADALGDIVFVSLPAMGETVEAGQALGEVESTKSVSDVYAPFGGTVTARNDQLEATPELVNSDPFGAGWLVELQVADVGALATTSGTLLDAAAYHAHLHLP